MVWMKLPWFQVVFCSRFPSIIIGCYLICSLYRFLTVLSCGVKRVRVRSGILYYCLSCFYGNYSYTINNRNNKICSLLFMASWPLVFWSFLDFCNRWTRCFLHVFCITKCLLPNRSRLNDISLFFRFRLFSWSSFCVSSLIFVIFFFYFFVRTLLSEFLCCSP